VNARSRTLKIVVTLAAIAAILLAGRLTRPDFVGRASYLEAPLPSNIAAIPRRTQCATWWLDRAVDRSTGAALPLASATVAIARNHVLDLTGWAYLDDPPREGRALWATWGDGRGPLAMFPLKRIDVPLNRHLPPTLRSGFFASIRTDGRPSGSNDLAFLIFDAQRRSMCWVPGVLTVVLTDARTRRESRRHLPP
jgi:hypothetical protein